MPRRVVIGAMVSTEPPFAAAAEAAPANNSGKIWGGSAERSGGWLEASVGRGHIVEATGSGQEEPTPVPALL